jgi:hypothetical protein
MDNRPYYGIQFLDDIHTYFPDILYNPDRFTNVQALLYYIRSQTSARFDLFSNAQRNYIVPNPYQANVTQPYTPQTPLRQPPPIVRQPPPPQPPQQSYYNTNRNLEIFPLNDILSSVLLGSLGQDFTLNATFSEPVTVAPSAAQIESATEIRQSAQTNDNVRCSICQDSFGEGQAIRSIRKCGHEFHRECIDIWFQRNVHCPMCRLDIRDSNDTDEMSNAED